MPGRALLIGVSDYGDGFSGLPAAQEDVSLMRQVLENLDFSVAVAGPDTVNNAANLDRAIADFCRDTDSGVNIIYFSGHGISLDNQDWIVPGGVSRNQAIISLNQRLSTDLSRYLESSTAELLLFIIDACRDQNDHSTAKGPGSWTHGNVDRADRRFVRLFGCESNEYCHVWKGGRAGQDISVFTRALATVLASGGTVETLRELPGALQDECRRIAKLANPRLPDQRPCLRWSGDLSEVELALLDAPIFRSGHPVGAASGFPVWEGFDPACLNCVVIESEHAEIEQASIRLADRVSDALLAAEANGIWESFRTVGHGRRYVSGKTRAIEEAFSPDLVRLTAFPVTGVFESDERLDTVVTALAQADLVVFDVSRFEPGVMFLLGVRGALRRGVTLCSHAQGWSEGRPLDIPFNLSDLQLLSHSDDYRAGDDPVVRRLVEFISKGFRQLGRQPRYLDLPAYDALRELGPGLESSGTIPWSELVLVLCSFQEHYWKTWTNLRRLLEKSLLTRKARAPKVQRLIDFGSPQLVSQALYEHIRRVSACVMDWSCYSPSVFQELGVRLAVSPWGAVQIIRDRHLPGGEHSLRIRTGAGKRKSVSKKDPELRQVHSMIQRFQPIPYPSETGVPADRLADTLTSRNPFDDDQPNYNRIHRVARAALEPVTVAHTPVYELLGKVADSLVEPGQERVESSQSLFSGGREVKRDRENAALEHRLAAWFYLEHRLRAGSLPEGDPLRTLHRELGDLNVAALYDSGEDHDFTLADHIQELMNGGGHG